jgi:hypothetical protein
MKCAWRSIITIAAASTGDCAHLWEEWVASVKYRRRIYYSAEQRAEIWDRWQRRVSSLMGGCLSPIILSLFSDLTNWRDTSAGSQERQLR